MNAFYLSTDVSSRQTGNPVLASAISALPSPRTASSLLEQPAKDSFEPSHKPKQPHSSTPLGAVLAGTVVFAGLVGVGIWQRENIARWWEQLFNKHTVATPEVTKQMPSIVNNNEPIAGLPEALRHQWEALPAELKPDLTAYDLTNPEQFNEFRIYVQGLHELKTRVNKPEITDLNQAFAKICESLGMLNFDEAWMALAQARRLSGQLAEDGKIGRLSIDEEFPRIFQQYGLTNDTELSSYYRPILNSDMKQRFTEHFHLADSEISTDSSTYAEILDTLKKETTGSLFLLSHYLNNQAHSGDDFLRQQLLLNLNGELYILPENFIMNDYLMTLDALVEQKLALVNENLKEGVEPRTKSHPYPRGSGAVLRIRKFEDLKIHPWLLNESA